VLAQRSLGWPRAVLARSPRTAGGYGEEICAPNVSTIFIPARNVTAGSSSENPVLSSSNRYIFCAVTCGLAGRQPDIPPECMTTPTTVRLLIAWSDGEDDDDCPTAGQVRAHYPGN